MENRQVYKSLAGLNELPAKEALRAFLGCCGSSEWARQMTDSRPFPMVEPLFERAEKIWHSLSPSDWLEAFAAHPKIGTKSTGWSGYEQAGIAGSDQKVLSELEEANRLYEEKFGFIFIVCATGKTADEMLAICRARYGNSVETEIRLAAEEQRKITEIRLTKLLEQ